MCLRTDLMLTKRAFATRKVPVKRYKVVTVRDGKLMSPVYSKQWRPGVNKSNLRKKRSKDEILKLLKVYKYATVNCGIHVFVTPQGAKDYILNNEHLIPVVIITLICDPKDLLGVGTVRKHNREAYAKVTFEKADYENAMKQLKTKAKSKAA